MEPADRCAALAVQERLRRDNVAAHRDAPEYEPDIERRRR